MFENLHCNRVTLGSPLRTFKITLCCTDLVAGQIRLSKSASRAVGYTQCYVQTRRSKLAGKTCMVTSGANDRAFVALEARYFSSWTINSGHTEQILQARSLYLVPNNYPRKFSLRILPQ
ncbi:hypothetical protein RRG08_023652 [Elysia crispata]|uniref:Uncharacterized protein n=1 Tax=Elysia crispata TaxID=231223 RepID=A0AAE0XSI9_9GAST|nr:hypothetical protein RRG08_023652 [Elysia crispata]